MFLSPQIVQSRIRIYEFPDGEDLAEMEEGERRENSRMKERVPFAVVGSNTVIESTQEAGKKVRGRKYPWGVVDVSRSRIQFWLFESVIFVQSVQKPS